MARCILMTGGGGGVMSEDTTVAAEDVLEGKTYLGSDTDDEIGVGTMPNNDSFSSTLNCGQSILIPRGYHTGSGKITANSLASQTPGNATAASMLNGRIAWVDGKKITGTIPSQGAATFSPSKGTTKTIITSGKYTSGDIKLAGFNMPDPSKLAKGYTYTLYGQSVTGTLTKDYDLIKGSTALVTFTNSTRLQGCYCAIPVGTTAYSSSKINLADYKHLKFYCCNFQYLYSSDIFSDTTGTHMNQWKVGFGENGSTFKVSQTFNAYSVCSIDISNYTGSYYILIKPDAKQPLSGSYGIVFDCWLTMT